MTRLVISVRNAREATAAAVAGADVIDVKEPRRGALGAASPRQLAAVAAAVNRLEGIYVLSAACGELSDLVHGNRAAKLPDPLIPYHLAKVGLAGCQAARRWDADWRRWQALLPPATAAVAAAYADWRRCLAPHPFEICEALDALGAAGLLIDTCVKKQGTIFDFLSHGEISRLIQDAHAQRKWVALAGSLGPQSIRKAVLMMPDLVAVRGAVCCGGRAGKISSQLVSQMAQIVRSVSGPRTAVRCPVADPIQVTEDSPKTVAGGSGRSMTHRAEFLDIPRSHLNTCNLTHQGHSRTERGNG